MSTPFISTLVVDNAHESDIFAVAACDKYTLAASGDGNLSLWDNREAQPEAQQLNRKPLAAGIHHLAVDRAGTRVLAVAFDGQVCAWDLKEHSELDIADLGGIQGAWACAVAADGSIAAVATLSGSVFVIDLEKLAVASELVLPQSVAASAAVCVDVSPDGRFIAAGFETGKVRIYTVETGRVAYTLPSPTASPRVVRFSPLGTLVAVAGENAIALFTLNGGSFVGTLEGHDAWIYDVSWSPSGEMLLSVSKDGIVKIWNMESREVIFTLADAQGPLFAGAWLPGNVPILAGSRAGMVTAGVDRSLRWYREASGSGI